MYNALHYNKDLKAICIMIESEIYITISRHVFEQGIHIGDIKKCWVDNLPSISSRSGQRPEAFVPVNRMASPDTANIRISFINQVIMEEILIMAVISAALVGYPLQCISS